MLSSSKIAMLLSWVAVAGVAVCSVLPKTVDLATPASRDNNIKIHGQDLETLLWKIDEPTSQIALHDTSPGFKWSDIKPAERLVYHPCFEIFQCARLEVPLDWNSTASEPDKLAIAIIKLPARVPVTDPRYGGPVLVNPGGPGGSGVEFIRGRGKARYLQTIVDAVYDEASASPFSTAESARYHDILSFDPRGINNTTPFFSCFSDSTDEIAWRATDELVLGGSETDFALLWARQKAKNEHCLYDEKTNRNGTKIASFVSTAAVVRDMVEILERHGEWREEQAQLHIATLHSQSAISSEYVSEHVSELSSRLRWNKGEEPLHYWGFSYGTVLGATFAAMQPHRANRLILDGVADAEDYYHDGWRHNLQDTDAVMTRFFEYCHAAGPDGCSMYTGNSPEDIRKAWSDLEDLITNNGPISVPATALRGPDVITMSDLKNLVFDILYKPLLKFPRMANILAPLALHGSGAAFADYKHKKHAAYRTAPPCAYIDPTKPECVPPSFALAGGQPILCGDGDLELRDGKDLPRADFLAYWHTLQNQSHFFGDRWATIQLQCATWRGRAAWKFGGRIASNVTAHPILWIGNSLDNVTPLRNAHASAARFRGSRVLQSDVEGHCSSAAPSLCVGRAVRAFFQTGELPEVGTVCKPVKRPFLGARGPGVEPLPDKLERGDELLLEALEGMWDDGESN